MSDFDRNSGNDPQLAPTQLPSLDDFVRDTDVAAQITEINRFAYTVKYQPQAALTNPGITDGILAACLDSLKPILIETGIHYLHTIKTNPQRPTADASRLDTEKAIVSISLQEGRMHFSLNIYDDRLTISRVESSFADFYEWYRRFMPKAQSLETTLRRAIERISAQRLDPAQTQYEFKLNFSDFKKLGFGGNYRTRNVDVLQTIIPSLPDLRGMTEISKQEFYRLDLNLSRLEEFTHSGKTKRRECWYILEAPFNEQGRFLVLTAQLRNSSLELLTDRDERGEPKMAPFDDDIAEDYYVALDGFFKGRALELFMARLLQSWEFKTQREL